MHLRDNRIKFCPEAGDGDGDNKGEGIRDKNMGELDGQIGGGLEWESDERDT